MGARSQVPAQAQLRSQPHAATTHVSVILYCNVDKALCFENKTRNLPCCRVYNFEWILLVSVISLTQR